MSQFVLKVHGRCDLACDHCYVYEHADQSWRDKPPLMEPGTVRLAAERIAAHAVRHRLGVVHVILHGGEPLLAGPDTLRGILTTLRAEIDPVTTLDLRMQSNGVLLTETMANVLAEFDVRVGISLDGDRIANDRHRRFKHGASSHDAVLRALELLRRPAYRQLYAGILCTVDVRNDPIRVYEALLAQQPPRIDLLLPHATWADPPAEGHGRWLVRVFDRWNSDGRPVPIRTFESLISSAAGGPSASESFGLDGADLAVIDTDGSWEQADSLKTTYHGAPSTGLTVFTHTVDDVAALPTIARRQQGLAGLSTICRSCPVVQQCGGGLLAHRFSRDRAFDNPSVYCADLKELIVAINERPAPSVPTVSRRAGSIPSAVFEQLGDGYGDSDVIGYLTDAELAVTRALLVAVADRHGKSEPAATAWSALARLDRSEPGAVAAVLAHPYIREWAVRCLDGRADSAYLANIAAAASIWAGAELDIPVCADHGQIFIPTVGSATLPAAGDTLGTLSNAAAGFTIRLAGETVSVGTDRAAAAGWHPVRRVEHDGVSVLLEDQDPYRDCYGMPMEGRLSPAAAAVWRDDLVAALETVRRQAPAYLGGLRRGLRALAPLAADPTALLRSVTSRHAIGAAAAAPAAPDSLAIMLVHEFQHSKMAALLDICPLYDPAYAPLMRVGWRHDPRPIEGVLQGAYAHLAVADMWRARAVFDDSDRAQSSALFRQYQDWTAAAIDGLLDCGGLTDEGSVFVQRMANTIAGFTK